MFNTGQPGPLRLFTQPLSKEVSWLLPFGLFSALLLVFRARPRWPLVARQHRALFLWGGWLITGVVFFSVAGFFHQYYLTMMAPPLAALVGIGSVETWNVSRRNFWPGIGLLLFAAGITVGFQMYNARMFVANVWWQPLAVAGVAGGAVALVAAGIRRSGRAAVAGFGLVIASVLVTPGVWSALTSMDPGTSSNLPAAYGGREEFGRGGMPFGPGGDRGQANQEMINFLEANTRGTKYLVAVDSANQGDGYVLATGRPVLFMGGFSGQDRVVTGEDLSRMAGDGELKYILWGGGPGGFGRQSDISTWIAANCTQVQGVSAGVSGFGGRAGLGSTLYQVNSTIGR